MVSTVHFMVAKHLYSTLHICNSRCHTKVLNTRSCTFGLNLWFYLLLKMSHCRSQKGNISSQFKQLINNHFRMRCTNQITLQCKCVKLKDHGTNGLTLSGPRQHEKIMMHLQLYTVLEKCIDHHCLCPTKASNHWMTLPKIKQLNHFQQWFYE